MVEYCGEFMNRHTEYNNRQAVKVHRSKQAAERRATHTDKVLFVAAKKRAKKLGIPFDLTVDDFKIPEFCPVFGTRFVTEQRNGKRADNAPSIDKIDPTKGYTKGNVAIISWRANRLKSDASLSELESLVRYVKERA